MNYQENQNKKVYNIDFDGTITLPGSYTDLQPNLEVITQVRNLYYLGHIIIIWTARWWDNASLVVGWLITHNVPFHGIFMGKGGSDCYVDDKNLDISTFLEF